MQLVIALLVSAVARDFPAAPPVGTEVSRRVEHIAEKVYESALEDFRLHAENRKLQAQAAALRVRLAAFNAPAGVNVTANGTSLLHQAPNVTAPVPLRPNLRAAAVRAAREATPKLAAIVRETVVGALQDAAASAARRVLAEACDSAVTSAVVTAHKVTSEVIGAEHADEVAEKVRVAVRDECLDESEVMAEKAVAFAEAQVRGELPAIALKASSDVVYPEVQMLAEQAQVKIMAEEAAAAAAAAAAIAAQKAAIAAAIAAAKAAGEPLNATMNATIEAMNNASAALNATLNATNMTMSVLGTPPPPVVNITAAADAAAAEDVAEIFNETSAATPPPLDLAPSNATPPVNVTIGNRTVEGATAEPALPTDPPPPPRVEVAMGLAVAEAMAASNATMHQELLPAKQLEWKAHFAIEMRRLSLEAGGR